MAKPKLENARLEWRSSPGWNMMLQALGVSGDQLAGMTEADYRSLLEDKVASLGLPVFAQTMISGPWSSELRSTLTAGDTTIARQVIAFEEPVLLIAMAFEITADTFGLAAPALKELDVRLDSRQDREFWTARNGAQSTSGQDGFVPCSTVDFRAPRYFMRVLSGTDPELGIEYRARYTTGYPNNIIVSAVAIAAPLFTDK